MNKVSKDSSILSDWKSFGRTLGLSDADIIEIDHANQRNIKEASYQCLVKWRSKKGRLATKAKLIEALRDTGANELAGNACFIYDPFIRI